jgi:hypothetical protein
MEELGRRLGPDFSEALDSSFIVLCYATLTIPEIGTVIASDSKELISIRHLHAFQVLGN